MGIASNRRGGKVYLNEQRMYIGPSIPGIVKYGTVFIGDLPGELTKKAAEIGSINNLVIPIDGITAAKKALSEPGSVENVSFSRIENYLKGEK